MINVNDATKMVLDNISSFGVEKIPFEQSLNRILAKDIIADRDFPPYNRVAMDGISICFESFKKGQTSFPIQATQAAGTETLILNNPSNCIEIMTGASLSNGTDTVIRYEDLIIENNVASIQIEDIKYQQNIHFKGQDRQAGESLVSVGKQLTAAEISIAAATGHTHLEVYKNPKTLIVSSGNELRDVGETPLPHQIRKSNIYSINAILESYGIEADFLHLLDDELSIEAQLKKALKNYELIILSGGVSKGKFDFIPDVLKKIGVEKLFHRVSQRPGQPFWFGKKGNKIRVFALPGNPVSTFMCTCKYVLPWLRKSLNNVGYAKEFAVLDEEFTFKPKLQYFLPVKLENRLGTLYAKPMKGNGSGDFVNLTEADAFLELPIGENVFLKGNVFTLIRYRI